MRYMVAETEKQLLKGPSHRSNVFCCLNWQKCYQEVQITHFWGTELPLLEP